MNILLIDPEGTGLDFALRCQEAGHSVQLWLPANPKISSIGKGMVPRPEEWKPLMSWADLILPTTNCKYGAELEPFFDKGYPILGANLAGAELELEREKGQKLLTECGIECPEHREFNNYDTAISYVKATKKAYVAKPWGGASDKALTYVSSSPADMVFKLQEWKKAHVKGSFMLQEKVSGIEMGISAWFGPGGWCAALEENWEEKKLMNDGLGCNTGEQGTTVRYVRRSKLFNEVLKPVGEHLHKIGYVGNVDVSCIIDDRGQPWPLEFTCRCGWPAFVIQTALLTGDPAEWMLDLLNGKDTLRVSDEIAVGVVMTHGDFPYGHATGKSTTGFPIYGITGRNQNQIHFQSVMEDVAPVMLNGEVKEMVTTVTAGDYVAVVVGCGESVRAAQQSSYRVCWQLDWPSNRMFRTDIGKRLKKELPALQQHGFAADMRYV